MELSAPPTAPAHARSSNRAAGCKKSSSPCVERSCPSECAILGHEKSEPLGSLFSFLGRATLLLRLAEIARHGSDKWPGRWRGSLVAPQYRCKGHVGPVERTRVLCVLIDNRTIQVDTGKQSLAAGVCEQFRLQRQVGRCSGVASHGSSGSRGIATNLK